MGYAKMSGLEFRAEMNRIMTSIAAQSAPVPVYSLSMKCKSCAASNATLIDHGDTVIMKCDYCGGSDVDVRKQLNVSM